MSTDNNNSFDVIVVGAGGAGLMSALTAASAGASVLILESEEGIGGTTLFSGGQVWVPNNHHMNTAGISDSREDVLRYMHETMPDRGDQSRWEAFVDNAPEMLQFLERNSSIRFVLSECPDTFSEKAGGTVYGRTVEVKPFPVRKLGKHQKSILQLPREFRVPVPLTFGEVMKILQRGKLALIAFLPAVVKRILFGEATMSKGLVAGLFEACQAKNVDVRLDVRVVELLYEKDRVAGVKASVGGRSTTFRSQRGVVLATGSFDWSTELREEFLPAPMGHSVVPPSNRGDAVIMARQVGAKLARMDEAWYWPVSYTGSIYKGAPLGKILRRRTYPHTIVVNRLGKRFANESEHNMGLALMYETDPETGECMNQPAWVISDNQFQKRYEEFAVKISKPEWLIVDKTLAGLAEKIGVDADSLKNTVNRFNRFAEVGEDPDFQRNEFEYDRIHGDLRAPFASLGTVEEAPFYAVRVHAGAVGTKGGPMTNASWQVLRDDDSIIDGLYAVGNCSAAIIGPGTIAPAGTLGPALTEGYIAGTHVVANT
jgi:succinate dehydrogenase/fumarate reductase flavoprotein subunit